ncbi:MAG: FHA domain-containing protein [Coriobacteriia bacterium]|nr:FHA domain-containing protein [Coriobacteriia bacterium]
MSTKCPICLQEFEDGIEECPACGFKFSGNTEKFKPIKADNNEEGKNTQGIDKKSSKTPALRVISGPQGELVLPLTKDNMTIGRSPNSDIFLNDRTVSREHAVISKNGDVYQIADKNSYNGLWINNNNVSVSNVKDGDLIQIGVFFLRFEC